MRLTILFLLLTFLTVYGIDRAATPRQAHKAKKRTVYVRQEGKNCPLYYPAEELR